MTVNLNNTTIYGQHLIVFRLSTAQQAWGVSWGALGCKSTRTDTQTDCCI